MMNPSYQKMLTAKILRSLLETVAEFNANEAFVYELNLGGLASVASIVLAKLFQTQGFSNVQAVKGEYCGQPHCWVNCGDTIWDLTATQFNQFIPKIYTCSLMHRESERYKQLTKISLNQSPNYLKLWIGEASPNQDLIDSLFIETKKRINLVK
jgi:hypothetical protein